MADGLGRCSVVSCGAGRRGVASLGRWRPPGSVHMSAQGAKIGAPFLWPLVVTGYEPRSAGRPMRLLLARMRRGSGRVADVGLMVDCSNEVRFVDDCTRSTTVPRVEYARVRL